MFDLRLEFENAQNLSGIPFDLSFDPSALKLLGMTDGPFLRQDGQAVTVVQRTEGDGSKIAVRLNRPPDTTGISGSGTILVFSFKALRAGATQVGVTRGFAPISLEGMVPFIPFMGDQTTLTIRGESEEKQK